MKTRHVTKRTALAGLAVALLSGALFRPSLARASATWLTPEQFGAKGDGRTSDTAAINRALRALAEGDAVGLRFRNTTYLVDGPLDGTKLANVRLVGPATFKAGKGADFRFILSIAGSRDTVLENLTLDANKAERGNVRGHLSCLDANRTTRVELSNCTFQNSLGIVAASGASSVAVSASDGCKDILIQRCQVRDCGDGPDSRPSDGIFVRGDGCVITKCHAENVTDHAFVLEGCNRSRIQDCSGINCTSLAGISNDTANDAGDNLISGIIGTCGHLGSFGGMIGAYAFGKGRLVRCTIKDVQVRVADGARGHGAGLFLHGSIDGLTIEHVSIDAGSTAGVMTHALVIDAVAGVHVRNSRFRADRIGSCIRLLRGASGVVLEANELVNGAYGIYADGAATFAERRNRFIGCRESIEMTAGASLRS